MKTKYKFSHRASGRYYWKARVPGQPSYEDQISCSVMWFWGWTTTDTSLPGCDCKKAGIYGGTGMMPDGDHIIVIHDTGHYLAHKTPN